MKKHQEKIQRKNTKEKIPRKNKKSEKYLKKI